MDPQPMEERPTVLIPLKVLERESIPEGVPELLQNAHVVLLGYTVVPDQTSTSQASDQFEDKASSRLDDLTAILEDAGATVESKLVFTHDGQTTIDRVTEEEDALAVLIPNSTRAIEHVLVPVRGVVGIDRFVRLLSGLFAPAKEEGLTSRVRSAFRGMVDTPTEVNMTLFHVAEGDETDEDVATLLDGIANRLTEEGLSPDQVETEVVRGEDPQDAIVDASDTYDAIIMGESDPSVTTFLFGMTADQVAKQFLGPVFVLQHEQVDGDEEEEAD